MKWRFTTEGEALVQGISVAFSLHPQQHAESDTELNAPKMMVGNAVAFFYPGESSFEVPPPQMLNSLPTRSQEIILANMRQSASITLGILMSLYPRADLDAVGEGFAVTCSNEEALRLVEDSARRQSFWGWHP
jgi:hypothetical protein